MNVTSPKQNQRRQHLRHELSGKVFIHNEEHIFIAPLNNVGRGGVFVDKLVSIELGQKVKVVIKSASLSIPIQATGIIVRVETEGRFGTAVQFDWVEPSGLAQLQ